MRAFTLFVNVLLFLATFSLEVGVHAGERKDVAIDLRDIQQEPRNCLRTDKICAVENFGEAGFELKVGDSVVILDQGSSVIRKSAGEIRLVKGAVWIKANQKISVSSEFGSAENTDNGDFWASKTAAQLTALAVSTDVELKPRGSVETLIVSQGLQNTIGQIGFNGQAATGIPMPIPFKDHVMRWGRLYRGPKKDFEAQVDAFHERWAAATVASATIHQALFDREIASANEAAANEAAKKQKLEAENQALRNMFRQRMLNGM